MKDYRFPLYASILTYLLLLGVMVLANIYEAGFNLYYGWLYPVLPAFVIYWVFRGLRNWGWIIVVPAWLVIFGEIFCVYFYHTPYSIHIVQLLLNTTANECSDFIREAVVSRPFVYSLLLSTGIAVVAYGVFRLSELRLFSSKYVKYAGLVLVLGSTGLLAHSYYTLTQRFLEREITYFILHRDDKPCYFTPLTRLTNGIAYAYDASFLQQKVKTQMENAKVNDCSHTSPLIVLVIGESYNKYHTPLYNASYRNTTPYLCGLRDRDSLLVFDDVVAPFNLTNELFHALFSTCPYDSLNRWYDYPLFTAIFKKAGYKVSFLSNQFALHNNDIWNHQTGGIFNSPEMSDLQFAYHNKEVFPYDGELLRLLPEHDSLTSSPHLLIIHFMGQHVSYEERYPESFRYFTPEDTETSYGGTYARKIVADYDNSLRYNDHVMQQIIDYVKPLDAILIYFADHGEEVYDWRDAFMRTSEPTIPAEVAKYQYAPPFVVYITDKYSIGHPQLAQAMSAAVHLPVINTDIPNVLFHLAGISTPVYYPDRDFLSPQYNPNVPRILRYDVDYNRLMKAEQ